MDALGRMTAISHAGSSNEGAGIVFEHALLAEYKVWHSKGHVLEVRIPCKEGQLQAFGAICENETFWRFCGSNKVRCRFY